MSQKIFLRIWQPIALDINTESQVCERVAKLELSDDPNDQVAAEVLRKHFYLDGVWIEDAKEQSEPPETN